MDPERYDAPQFGRATREPGNKWAYWYYRPAHIPRDLPLQPLTVKALSDADAALGRLQGVSALIQDPELLIGPYLTQEAVASSRIEGTQTSLEEVLQDEVSGQATRSEDVAEVKAYLAATRQGFELIKSWPLSQRLVLELHKTLLTGVRGQERHPGEFRRTPVWVGSPTDNPTTAAYVPPLPPDLPELIADWEAYVNVPDLSPTLVRCALMHYQFETIHPFLDGNGRIGRLLIVFFLVVRDRLPSPLLYLSPFFEARRQAYYEALQGVRQRGELDAWLRLFLDGVQTQANDALARAERLSDLRERYRASVQATTRGGANRLVDLVFEQPVVNSRTVERRLGLSRPAALNALRQLETLGILGSAAEGPRGQLRWRAQEVLELLVADGN